LKKEGLGDNKRMALTVAGELSPGNIGYNIVKASLTQRYL
jgi:hypothetical protein